MEYLMHDLRRCPRYSRQELIDLGRQYQERGDLEAREQMILGILPLAIKQSRKYHRSNCRFSMLELVSEAMEGVIKAVDRFDPERGVALTTYAMYWINQYLLRAVRSHGVIYIPHYAAYPGTKHATPELLARVERANAISSIYATGIHVDWGRKLCLADTLEDYRGLSEAQMRELDDRRCLQDGVHEAIEEISDDRVRDIVACRLRGQTLSQLGQRYGVSRERISQLEKIGHRRLREILLATEAA